jgi:hypothetical protein
MTKTCPLCGTEDIDDTVAVCDCGYAFSERGRGEAPPSETAILERPTGETPILIAWVCLFMAATAFLISLAGSGESLDSYLVIWGLRVAAGALFSLFLILWSVGYVVRAMSFLPGVERRPVGPGQS